MRDDARTRVTASWSRLVLSSGYTYTQTDIDTDTHTYRQRHTQTPRTHTHTQTDTCWYTHRYRHTDNTDRHTHTQAHHTHTKYTHMHAHTHPPPHTQTTLNTHTHRTKQACNVIKQQNNTYVQLTTYPKDWRVWTFSLFIFYFCQLKPPKEAQQYWKIGTERKVLSLFNFKVVLITTSKPRRRKVDGVCAECHIIYTTTKGWCQIYPEQLLQWRIICLFSTSNNNNNINNGNFYSALPIKKR